jgi:DivIVA domain-containing protein
MAKDTPGEGWGGAREPGASRSVTPLEIQQKEFAVARFGGYKMRDVDEFLDELTESVSALATENERLRRQAGADPVVGSPDLDDVARQADEIIQRARDEASRIVAEANGRAATIAGSVAAGAAAGSGADEADAVQSEAIQAFLTQERAFLQSLAALVQGHVESVKGMARTAPKPAQPATATDAPAEGSEDATARTETASGAASEEGMPAGPPPSASSDDDADATQVMPEADEPIRLDEPQRASASRTKDEGDDSLRELFWGEEN